ncbi:SDR family oxidoreductase [Gammaproteobacteria bacterium]|nr:SDR family oxidoreductase [Gammaproteobacteria bacterium]
MVSKNPVAIVTGGSRGVGAASAKLLASNGWNVIITCSSSIDQAEKIASQCSNQLTEVIAIKADVAQDKDCCLTVDAAIKKWGRLDALINNAGTTKFAWDHADLAGVSSDDFHDIYSVNVVGPFQMARAAKEYLLNSHNPSIVNISSIAGIKGIGSSIAYAASKGALNTMTLSMARNLGPIRVNAVCPGFIEGDWLKNGMGMERYEATKNHIQSTAPLSKTCSPESIAEVIVGLIERSELVTGQLITVDGGVSLNL